MYKKVSTSLDFVDREKEILKFWEANDIFKKSIESRKNGETYTFYDGPPTANGMPHIGHILTRVMKDIIPRYRTMKGYKVLRKAGWDTHGLPVELEVEKLLGIDGKPQIEKYGIEPFIKQCKKSVWKYESEWRKMSERVGFWADMDDPYVTYHNEYIESVWWSLKQIWDKDLLYKGHKIVPYCPRCGTSLSSHEVAQGYKDVTDISIFVKFKRKGAENEYFLAWTTTPWTLPSNVALTINQKENYSRVSYKGETYILATELVGAALGSEASVLETFKGKDLLGLEYEPLFDFAKPDKKAYYICAGDFVTLTDGTGIVHTAPAFGEDDAKVGQEYGLPFVQLVNEQGLFVDSVKQWKGMFVKDADPLIIEDLKQRGLLFNSIAYEHSYPFCWRCDTHLLYYARDTWFIKMSEIRDRLLKNNDTINWLPENIKTGRFGNFLENVIDWGLSRERYWGTPLPIWECACGHRTCIGSIEELKANSSDGIPDDLELHKPYIDNVFLDCPHCGKGKMKRVSEVIDCWYDSGSMPFAQWHYPFENKEIFDDNFPADFICEAIDQTRGWFYTLLAISTLLFDRASYKNCIVLGHVQDREGQKMSKHKGNVVDPWSVLDKQGADAVRWYFYTSSAPWLPSRFYEDAVSEGQRKFMGTLWNTYAFYVLYANIDGFDPTKYKLEPDKLSTMDKWILSGLNTLVKKVDSDLSQYLITEPARAIQEFTDDLSNWYVRRSRERYWQKGMPQDKINAYMVLYTVLVTLTKVSAPFVPFMAEEIYQNLVRSVDGSAPESVHLCDFPASDAAMADRSLEENMGNLLQLVVQGRACRNKVAIKNRQPLARMYVQADFTLDQSFTDIIKDELNVKDVVFTDSSRDFTTYRFKPQLKTLGPRYGKNVAKIGEWLAAADGNELMDRLEKGTAAFELNIGADAVQVELALADVLYESTWKEGYVSDANGSVTVVLDTKLTDELIEEGFVREITSKIQTQRKEAGLEVQDRILFGYRASSLIDGYITKHLEEIKAEILADAISATLGEGFQKEWDINGEKAVFSVEKH